MKVRFSTNGSVIREEGPVGSSDLAVWIQLVEHAYEKPDKTIASATVTLRELKRFVDAAWETRE